MKAYYSLALAVSVTCCLSSFHPSTIKITDIGARLENEQVIRGYLSEGRLIDIDWANNTSNVACFPAADNKKFNGSHRLYSINMPSHSFLKLSAVSDKDVSMYAYQIEENDTETIPPYVNKVYSCSVSHNKGNGRKNPELIQLSTREKPRRVIFAVAGTNKLSRGAFQLKVELTSILVEGTTHGY